MSHQTFLISDTHFGHEGMIKFLRNDGTKLRPFNTIEEHDETLIDNWNKVVRPVDRVYHCGDAVINRRYLHIFNRLSGRKKLIRGNHDLFKLADYIPYFEDVYGVYVLKDMILSHIPLHPDCVTERFKTNVHGHLHAYEVMKTDIDYYERMCIDGKTTVAPDPRYISVCCEHINYTPINIEALREKIKQRT